MQASIKSEFTLNGMTCGSCENTISSVIKRLPGVLLAEADVDHGSLEIRADRPIALAEVRAALRDFPKYSVALPETAGGTAPRTGGFLQVYRPLLVLFGLVFLVGAAAEISFGALDPMRLMRHLMAGFFIGLSLFKFLDLRAFAESFAGYDPVARIWPGYGLLYPFLELGVGLLFVSGQGLRAANALTILVLTLTTIGVVRRLRSKNPMVDCACLGTTFKLPLSRVTVAENTLMIAMAVYAISR